MKPGGYKDMKHGCLQSCIEKKSRGAPCKAPRGPILLLSGALPGAQRLPKCFFVFFYIFFFLYNIVIGQNGRSTVLSGDKKNAGRLARRPAGLFGRLARRPIVRKRVVVVFR